MHRFYVFHSFSKFHRNDFSTCALFLAAKVEEQPRKLEHVIKVAHMCLNRNEPALDVKSEAYMEKVHNIVINENTMLQTLGFDIAINHPHTYVVKCCQLVRASKELAQTSYFMATNSLHLTTMCLQYKPTAVACVCIHLACKWSNWEIPPSNQGKSWFYYVDPTVTLELLEELTSEFIAVLDQFPSRLKQKITSGSTSKESQQLSERKLKLDNSNASNLSIDHDRDLESFLESKEFLDPQREIMSMSLSQHSQSSSSKSTPPIRAVKSSSGSSRETSSFSMKDNSSGSGNNKVEMQSPSKKRLTESSSIAHSSITLAAYRDREVKDRKEKPHRQANDGVPSNYKMTKSGLPALGIHTEGSRSSESLLNTHGVSHPSSSNQNKQQSRVSEDGRVHQSHNHSTQDRSSSKSRHSQQTSRHQSEKQGDRNSSKLLMGGAQTSTHHHHSRESRHLELHEEHSSLTEMPETKHPKMYFSSAQQQQQALSCSLMDMSLSLEMGDSNSIILQMQPDGSKKESKRSEGTSQSSTHIPQLESLNYPEDKYLNIVKPKEEIQVPSLGPSQISQQSNSSVGMNLGSISNERQPVVAVKSPAVATKAPVIATKSPAVIATKSPVAAAKRQRHNKRKSPVVALEPLNPYHQEEGQGDYQRVTNAAFTTPGLIISEQHEKKSGRKKSPQRMTRDGGDQGTLDKEFLSDPASSLLPAKYERRDKHRQGNSEKHSDKAVSNRSLDQTTASKASITSVPSGGLKITIPKDKVLLSSIKQQSEPSLIKGDQSGLGPSSPPREALKIKIPKMKISVGDQSKPVASGAPAPDVSGLGGNSAKTVHSTAPIATVTAPPLKLVLTKDRLNSGSYSASNVKSDREYRKRERYPKDPSMGVANQEEQQTMENNFHGAKVARTTGGPSNRGGRGRKVGLANPPHAVADNNNGRMQSQHYASSNGKADMHYMQQKTGGGRPPQGHLGPPHPQQYNMMPYGRPDYYQQQQPQFYQYQTQVPPHHPQMGPHMGYPPQGMPQGMYSNPPPIPTLHLGHPPLPREPPPLPPPLPPGDR